MKKALIFTTKEGHLSLALAAKQALENNGFAVQLSDLISNKTINYYTPFYRYFPFLFKVPYKIGESDTVKKAAKLFIERKLTHIVKENVKKQKPDLLISTNMFYYPAVTKVLDYQKSHLPYIHVVSDPWTIHSGMFCPQADYNLVYDKKGLKIGKKNKISQEKMQAIGWMVRNNYYKKYNSVKIKKKLGFKQDIFTMLICGGSEGTNMILKIIPALLTIKKPIQVIVVCGTNKRLYKALNSFKKLLSRLKKSKIAGLNNIHTRLNIKLFQFTNNLPQLINTVDLVIGKAGPNLIFETVAQKRPFLAICHISGQEDGNLELIKKKKLGFVEQNAFKVIKLLKKIINKPKTLDKFKPHILKEREYNLAAKNKFISIAKKLVLA